MILIGAKSNGRVIHGQNWGVINENGGVNQTKWGCTIPGTQVLVEKKSYLCLCSDHFSFPPPMCKTCLRRLIRKSEGLFHVCDAAFLCRGVGTCPAGGFCTERGCGPDHGAHAVCEERRVRVRIRQIGRDELEIRVLGGRFGEIRSEHRLEMRHIGSHLRTNHDVGYMGKMGAWQMGGKWACVV